MNVELVTGCCVACIVGGWIIFMIGKKKTNDIQRFEKITLLKS